MQTVSRHVERAAAGHPKARAWLVETCYGYVLKRVTKRYGRYLDPEDVTQQVFLCLLKPEATVLKKYLLVTPVAQQREATLRRYLWDQACGVASNLRRGRSRRRDFPVAREEYERREDPRVRVEEEIVNRDLLKRCFRWVRENGGHRDVTYLNLRYRLGYRPIEIAGATGWSLDETYRRREKLCRVLKRWTPSKGNHMNGENQPTQADSTISETRARPDSLRGKRPTDNVRPQRVRWGKEYRV